MNYFNFKNFNSYYVIFILISLCILLGFYFIPILTTVLIFSFFISLMLRNARVYIEKIVPPKYSILVISVLFFTLYTSLILFLIPQMVKSAQALLQDFPIIYQTIYQKAESFILEYTTGNIDLDLDLIFQKIQTTVLGQLNQILNSFGQILEFAMYIFLLPIFVVLLLKDFDKIIVEPVHKLPSDLRKIVSHINVGIYNYINGKNIEGLILAFSCYLLFVFYDLDYKFALVFLMWLSVFIPYIGIVLASIPVVIIAFYEFSNDTTTFYTFLGVYTLIQVIDGNIIIPILFSNLIKLPAFIILLAILVFGSLFGIIGIIFSIPFAIIIKILIEEILVEKKN